MFSTEATVILILQKNWRYKTPSKIYWIYMLQKWNVHWKLRVWQKDWDDMATNPPETPQNRTAELHMRENQLDILRQLTQAQRWCWDDGTVDGWNPANQLRNWSLKSHYFRWVLYIQAWDSSTNRMSQEFTRWLLFQVPSLTFFPTWNLWMSSIFGLKNPPFFRSLPIKGQGSPGM